MPLALGLAASGCHAAPETTAADRQQPAADKPAATDRVPLGLMTTLPIYWNEASNVGQILQSSEEASWVRQALETQFVLTPLDTLEASTLAGLDRLILAQPRALAPAENVALDAWVRRGGRLLLFADPMLTQHSRYGLGDRRRPQDVVLLSPILKHWGLELLFDENQQKGERLVSLGEIPVPVQLAGTLKPTAEADCTLWVAGILAHCRLDAGQVTIFGDATALDEDSADIGRAALHSLLEVAFTDDAGP